MATSEQAGRPLDRAVRQRLERSLAADLTEVRVHYDELAHAVATTFGADAVTAGTDIYFARGHGDPSTEEGLRLLAQEVAHVVQQERLSPETWLQAELPTEGARTEGARTEAPRTEGARTEGARTERAPARLDADAERWAELALSSSHMPSVARRATPT
jgi:hypothetical protein